MKQPNIYIIIRFFVLAIIAYSVTPFFTLTDARHLVHYSNFQGPKFSKNSIQNPMKKPKLSTHVNFYRKFYLSSAETSDLSSSFPLPPLGSMAPISSPHNHIPAAPFCIYPPFPFQSPPLSPLPYGPSPPKSIPSPPVLHPPPAPPPHKNPRFATWCVVKPTVPDSIIQEAVDYACGSGADCKPIQPNGSCFQPNTLIAHASYAFNSYWQSTKLSGGTCDFGGIAMLVTTDPSFDDCSFIYN